jgi:peptide/nickel transport system substrate-binding protein
MNHQRISMLAALVLSASMILGACGPAGAPKVAAPASTQAAAPTQPAAPAATSAASDANTLVIGTTDSIASFDPADAYAVRDWEVIKNIDDTPLKWQPGSGDKLIPDLATAMPTVSADGLTYTITLKDGVKFGDGTDLTAQVYADSMNRVLKIGPDCPNGVAGALVTPYVDSVEATDAHTVVFHLKEPVAYFLQLLASPPYAPADPNIFPADKCELYPTPPIYGTGPWYVSQFTPNQQIAFEPNPYYSGDFKPQVKQIIVRFFSDPQTEALAVQDGEIDVAWRYLGGDLIGKLKGISGLHVGTINGGSIRYLIINHTMKPMDDPNVDKAIASIIDRNEISDTVFGGEVNPIYSMVPPGFLGASQSFDTTYQAPNLDAAKKYLEASGYSASNPLQFDLWYPPEHYGTQTSAWVQVIQKQLEATGMIKVTLKSQEWSTYVTACTGGDAYPVCVLGWFYDYPDPADYLDPFVYNGGQGTNVAPKYAIPASTAGGTPEVTTPTPAPAADEQAWLQYGKPIDADAQKLVSLLNQSDVETDLTKRADLLKQAQDLYAQMVVTVPLFLNPEYVVYRDNIHANDQYPSPETLNIGATVEFTYSMLSKSP